MIVIVIMKETIIKPQSGGLSKGQASLEALIQSPNNSNHCAGHTTHILAQGQLPVVTPESKIITLKSYVQ